MGSHSCMGLQSLTLVHFMGRRLLLLLRGGRTRKQVSTRLGGIIVRLCGAEADVPIRVGQRHTHAFPFVIVISGVE